MIDRRILAMAVLYLLTVVAACFAVGAILWVPLILAVIICGLILAIVTLARWSRNEKIEALIDAFREEMDRTL